VLAGLAVGVLVLAGSVLCYYLIFRFGWAPLLRSGAVRRLNSQWRYVSMIFLCAAIGASSAVPFIQGSYWLALALLVGGMALALATNLLRFRAAKRH
jgi:hypothetical protein